MTPREGVLLVTALFLISVLVAGTSGVSSTGSNRPIQIGAVDDDSAYLGVEQVTSETTGGTTDLNLTVVNRFPRDTELVWVEIHVGQETRTPTVDGPLVPGEPLTVSFDSVSCGAPIEVNATGDGVGVHLNRSVNCE